MQLPYGNLQTTKASGNPNNRARATCNRSPTPWCGFIGVETFTFSAAALQIHPYLQPTLCGATHGASAATMSGPNA